MIGVESRAQLGFTLIELMIVVVIMVVVLALTAPAFQSVIESNRLRTEINTITTTLALARSEAVTQNTSVSICPSSDGTNCSGNYAGGWMLFTGSDTTSPGPIIRVFDGPASGYSIRDTGGGITTGSLSFFPDGSSAAMIFLLCPPDLDVSAAWRVELNTVGRPRVKKGLEPGWKCSP